MAYFSMQYGKNGLSLVIVHVPGLYIPGVFQIAFESILASWLTAADKC